MLACDIAGSAAPLVSAIETAIAQGFVGPELRGMLEVTQGVPATLARLAEIAASGL